MLQTSFKSFYNQGLFSGNYLEHHLPETSIWKENEEKIRKAHGELAELCKEIKGLNLGPGEEANLESKFIQPVLRILGYDFDVQPTTQRGFSKKRPDYALFKDKASLQSAREYKTDITRFFTHPLTILEAKYWDRRLNDADSRDTLDSRDPTAQTVKYLDDVYRASQSRIKWAVLTNGKLWRLFYYHAASRSGNFYEVDLEELIANGDLDKFKYFYLFFSKDAFVPNPATGRSWLDMHLKGSEDYAAEVSARIKELIFDRVFEGLSKGFIEYRRNETGVTNETEKSLKEIFNGCLTLLYRLLFLLYAESRGLLPVDDNSYYKKSLKKLKGDITKDVATIGLSGMSHKAYDYWSRFESLCRIVDEGDSALNVPIYNGGLFETRSGSFLADNKISDPYLADAIYLLTTEQRTENHHASFIDYSSLGVRHLGDIYEGLLEFHIRVAEEEMIEVREKGKLLWKPARGIEKTKEKKQKIPQTRKVGEVYIENSKHERKATGSYYTPHYIVEYIVKNSVGRVLEERLDKARTIVTELEGLYEKQRRQLKQPKEWKHWEHAGEPKGKHIDKIIKLEREFYEIVFDIKALDPAMGSGHFLVHTVDFISDRIVTFLAEYPDNPVIRRIEEMRTDILKDVERQGVSIDETKLTEVNLIKRTVMKRCIYGVDLNEMAVELSKLSLWLDSFTLGAPLSFLDHHLKCGNSLVGTDLESLEKAQKGELYTVSLEPLQRAIRDMIFVSSLSDATYEQVKDSADKYHDADSHIEGYRILLDILVSEHFGIKDARAFLLDRGTKIDLNNLGKSIESMSKKDRETIETIEKIAGEKRFFHWEIEFPEVFYERVGDLKQKLEKKANPGFDCVIGNPPYGVAFEKSFKAYLNEKFIAAEYQLESFTLFIEQAISLLRQNGTHSYITPTTWLSMHYYENLRTFLLENNRVKQVLFFKEPVFENATVETCIEVVEKGMPNSETTLMIGTVLDKSETLETKWVEIAQEKIEKFEGKRITAYLTPQSLDLIGKVRNISLPLRNVSEICNGLKPYEVGKGTPPQTKKDVENRIYDAIYKKNESYKPFLRGEDFHRYNLNPIESRWLNYGECLAAPRPTTPFFAPKKITIRQTADKIIATIDDKQYLNLNNVHNLLLKGEDYFLEFILSLLNSRFLSFVHTMIVPEFGRVFAEVKIVNLEKLPIPRISFTTPEDERKDRVAEGIGLYKKCMLALESEGVSYDKTAEKNDRSVADPHAGGEEESLSGEHTGASGRVHGLRGRAGEPEDAGRISKDPDKALDWVDGELAENRNDTIHDFLAHLAEQMIEMNKKKNAEIKDFLGFLSRRIDKEVDDLKNKTKVKSYHASDFGTLIKILEQNKIKLSFDDEKRLEEAYNQSLGNILPVIAQINATDSLIDQVVYKLYGLTDEEIMVVAVGAH